jgi:hypothetical protein
MQRVDLDCMSPLTSDERAYSESDIAMDHSKMSIKFPSIGGRLYQTGFSVFSDMHARYHQECITNFISEHASRSPLLKKKRRDRKA